jgi:phage N-6-adenine-methyltransferase
MSPMPVQKPHRSKQNFETPEHFLAAVKHKLGITEFAIDLAAEEENTVAEYWYDREMNALVQTWAFGPVGSWNWLNPEFGTIAPWVERSWTEQQRAGAQTAVLVPAGVGADWWGDWVHDKAYVLLLNGRLCFIKDWATTIDPATEKPGKGPPRCYSQPPLYPKDCCLLLYSSLLTPGYEFWDWRKEIPVTVGAPAAGAEHSVVEDPHA